jgi:predicted nuclease with TOPRIM domain
MEKDQIQKQRYALSLDKTIQSHYHYLKDGAKEFQEKCQRVAPEKKIPPDIINQIRGAYKEIRDRLTEIRSIQQLLQTKYRQFYHRDPTRDKEMTEFEFLAKNAYSKFEYILKQIEAKKKLERERLAQMTPNKKPPRETL